MGDSEAEAVSKKEVKVDYSVIKEMPTCLVVSIAASRDWLISSVLLHVANSKHEQYAKESIDEDDDILRICKLETSRTLLESEQRWIRVAKKELERRIIERKRRTY